MARSYYKPKFIRIPTQYNKVHNNLNFESLEKILISLLGKYSEYDEG